MRTIPGVERGPHSGPSKTELKPELGLLSYELTQQVHNFVAGGRIDSASVLPDDLIVTVETPT